MTPDLGSRMQNPTRLLGSPGQYLDVHRIELKGDEKALQLMKDKFEKTNMLQ